MLALNIAFQLARDLGFRFELRCALCELGKLEIQVCSVSELVPCALSIGDPPAIMDLLGLPPSCAVYIEATEP